MKAIINISHTPSLTGNSCLRGATEEERKCDVYP
jgi:hypothetical protein